MVVTINYPCKQIKKRNPGNDSLLPSSPVRAQPHGLHQRKLAMICKLCSRPVKVHLSWWKLESWEKCRDSYYWYTSGSSNMAGNGILKLDHLLVILLATSLHSVGGFFGITFSSINTPSSTSPHHGSQQGALPVNQKAKSKDLWSSFRSPWGWVVTVVTWKSAKLSTQQDQQDQLTST